MAEIVAGTRAEAAALRPHSHIDWAAALAGTAVAAAIAVVLGTFGSALGLSMSSPYRGEGASAAVFAVATGLWIVWVAATASLIGGYVAGRMRRRLYDATPHEVDIRDGIHGIVVWALAALLTSTFAASLAAGVARTGGEAAKAAVSGAAQAAGAAAEGEGNLLAYTVDRMLRPPADGSVARSTDVDPQEVRREATAIVARSVAGGSFADDDRQRLAALSARLTGMSPQDARAQIDRGIQELEQAEQAARDAAETARKAGIVAAFLAAAAMLVAAAAAWWGATAGGRHRDEATDFTRWFPRR